MPEKNTRTRGFKSQLAEILKEHAGASERRRGKAAGGLTANKRWQVLFQSFEELRGLGYKLENPRNFRLKHMRALVPHWESKNLAPSTIQNKISILRVFAGWIGKPDMIPATEALTSTPEAGRRSYAASIDKSWEGNGVDCAEQVERIRQLDPRMALQVELAAAFGLRVGESWHVRPAADIVPLGKDGYSLRLLEGTKGKRLRHVPVESERQEDVLGRARQLAGNGSMMPPGCTKAEWRNHYYWILRKLGITRKEMGVTMHGLRHQYVHGQYLARLGVDVPVKGGGDTLLSKDEAGRQKHFIAENLGHSRPSIVTVYSGSKRSVKKPRLDWGVKHGSGSENKPDSWQWPSNPLAG